MANIVDIPIFKKRFVVLMIGIIIGFLLISFINNNYPSILNCNTTEKFSVKYNEYPEPLNNNERVLYDKPSPYPETNPYNSQVQSNFVKSGIISVDGSVSNNVPLQNVNLPIPPQVVTQPITNQQIPSGFMTDDIYATIPATVSATVSVINQPPVVNTQMDPVNIPEPSSNDDIPYASIVPIVQQPVMGAYQAPPMHNGNGVPPMNNGMGAPPMHNGMGAPPMHNGMGAPRMNNGNCAQPPLVPQQVMRAPQPQAPSMQAGMRAPQTPSNGRSTSIKMYNFNTEWCGWSKKFQPEWDAFMANVKSDNTLNSIVEVKDVKCDNDNNKELCADNNIQGFPTVVINVNGNNSKYDGPRTSEALMKKLKDLLK